MEVLDTLCRFCAQELVSHSIGSIFEPGNNKLLKLAGFCFPGSISADDRYPKLSCSECIGKMYVISDFLEMGSSALKVFDDILSKTENQTCELDQNELVQIKVELIPDVEFEEEERKYQVPEDTSLHVKTATSTCESIFPTEERPTECISKELCAPIIVNYSSENSQTQIGQKRLECKKCNLGFSRIEFFEKHMKTHTVLKTFNCNACNKSFSMKSALSSHMLVHNKDRKLNCEICKASFIKEYELQKHMTAHTGEKRYKCEECQRGFNQKYELARHRSSHTGEKPFKCEECEKCYREKCDLVRHMTVHKGERPHKCKECEKSFIREDYLAQHMVHHKGKSFQCLDCKKWFVYQSSLNRHKRKMICRLNLTNERNEMMVPTFHY